MSFREILGRKQPGYIFGGNTGETYEGLQSRRKAVERIALGNRTPRTAGEGLSFFGQALAHRALSRKEDAARQEGQNEFKSAFQHILANKVAGNGAELARLYSSPFANDAHKLMLKKRVDQLPHYRHGTNFHPGGMAVVGEDGPEVVQLPRGAKVRPNWRTAAQAHGDMSWQEQQENRNFLESWSDGFKRNLGPARLREFNDMNPDQQNEIIRRHDQGITGDELFNPDGMDMREMLMPYQDGMAPKSVFQPGAEYRTADASGKIDRDSFALDAYKLLSQQPQYDLTSIPGGKLTEGQSKLLSYLRKAMIADAMLDDPRLAQSMTRMDNAMAGKLGGLGRLYTNSDYELGRMAADLFSTALLRKESGAQTPEPEVARYSKMYAPLSNETETEIAAKSAIRKQEIRALQNALGTALPVGELIFQEIEALRGAATGQPTRRRFDPATGAFVEAE